ncbi:MAG: hypothetical protein EPO06_08695 [Burkholderiaceae bacterium]|nr:MAG: hypothetical protein EPO06_08695 [Burkholderiaceae bacterium]
MEKFSLEQRVDFLKDIKTKTDQQILLIQLSEKIRAGSELTGQEKKTFQILAAAEKTAWRARRAERAARDVFRVQGEQRRKKETHAKICCGLAALQMAKENEAMRNALRLKAKEVKGVDMAAVDELLGVNHAPSQ